MESEVRLELQDEGVGDEDLDKGKGTSTGGAAESSLSDFSSSCSECSSSSDSSDASGDGDFLLDFGLVG